MAWDASNPYCGTCVHWEGKREITSKSDCKLAIFSSSSEKGKCKLLQSDRAANQGTCKNYSSALKK